MTCFMQSPLFYGTCSRKRCSAACAAGSVSIGAWPTLGTSAYGLARFDQVRQRAANKQGGAAAREAPEGQARHHGRGPHFAFLQRRGNVRVVAQRQRAVGFFDKRAPCPFVPLVVQVRRERTPVDPLDVGRRFFPGADLAAFARVAGNAFEARARHDRADVVQHGRGHQIEAAHGQRHRDQAAHRRADEHGAGNAQVVHQLGHIARVRDRVVVGGVRVARRVAAPAYVQRQHAPALACQPWRQLVEVGRIARQAVQADDGQMCRAACCRIVARGQQQAVGAGVAQVNEITHGGKPQKRYSTVADTWRGLP
jgi:hypothetical protein